MSRALTIKNVYDKKHKAFQLDGIWAETIGEPETNGAWLIWGNEKNGKTWFALMLADYLSRIAGKVLYISAEEGLGKNFKESCERANIGYDNNQLQFLEYESIEEIKARLKKRKAPRIVLIDNITVYVDELKNGVFRKLLQEFPEVLFIYLAHEERGEPATATAKLCKKLAKIIVHVQGLSCLVSGRCPGGRLTIDEEKAALYHGQLNKAI